MTDNSSVEVLLHNVSHSDIVLNIKSHKSDSASIARPKFSCFRSITKSIIDSTHDFKSVKISSHLKHNRTRISENPLQYEVTPSSDGAHVPLGFDFCDHPIPIDDIDNLRFRREEKTLFLDEEDSVAIYAAYFPLLAVLIPKWLKAIQYNLRPNCRFILIFITGRGTPIDTSARIMDNSTYYTGKLMKEFIQLLYPFIEVQHLHSSTNLFRYDENVIFVKRELLPKIDKLRDNFIESITKSKLGDISKWKDYFKMTMSFADGSSARVSAINASLKHYRPDYMHFWQLKTFWSEQKICDDDIEWHSYEEISTETAMSLHLTEGTLVGEVVREMKAFIDIFQQVQQSSPESHDLHSFWLRKTKKPVLAILLVIKEDGIKKFYRGTNMEVSMPTGSLCAERNAIGSALAADLTLKRQDIKMVAVFSPNTIHPSHHPPVPSSLSYVSTGGQSIYEPPMLSSSSAFSRLIQREYSMNSIGGDMIPIEDSNMTTTTTMIYPSHDPISTSNISSSGNTSGIQISHSATNNIPRTKSFDIPIVLRERSDSELSYSGPLVYPTTTTTATSTTAYPERIHESIHGQNVTSTTTAKSYDNYVSIRNPYTVSQGSSSSSTTHNRLLTIHTSPDQEYSNQSIYSKTTAAPSPIIGQKRKILNTSLLYDPTTTTTTTSNNDNNINSETLSENNNNHVDSNHEVSQLTDNMPRQLSSSSAVSAEVHTHTKIPVLSSTSNVTSLLQTCMDTPVTPIRQTRSRSLSISRSNSTSHQDHLQQTVDSKQPIITRSQSYKDRQIVPTLSSSSSSSGIKDDNAISRTQTRSHRRVITDAYTNINDTTIDISPQLNLLHHTCTPSPTIHSQHHANDHNNHFGSTHEMRMRQSGDTATVIYVDDKDLNPIKPCGACMEWLKKIAEVNPRFSVITFTDVYCRGVYVEQIKD